MNIYRDTEKNTVKQSGSLLHFNRTFKKKKTEKGKYSQVHEDSETVFPVLPPCATTMI